MDRLSEKHLDTERGMHYRYYLAMPSTTPDPSKPVLLLLHGWPDGAALWQFMIPHLQTACPSLPILAPDLLGYGGTSKPTSPSHYQASLMVDDLLDILAHEGLAHLPLLPIGHDWGSHTAQRLYLLHPERCVGLVNLSLAYIIPSDEPLTFPTMNALGTKVYGYPNFAYWELLTAPDGPALLDARLESLWVVMHGDDDGGDEWWMKDMFCTPGAMREFLQEDRGREGDARALKPYAREGGGPREEWLSAMREGGMTGPLCWYRVFNENLALETERALPREVRKPYLYIGSTGDAVCRVEQVKVPIEMGLLKDAAVKQVEAGHWMPYERPEEVGEILVAWMREKGFA